MTRRYPEIAFGEAVRAVQTEQGSRSMGERLENMAWDDQVLGERERAFVESLDHFFMASVTESGWPYVQFRGGPTGFLNVLDDRTLGFADFRGNKQYISTGNVRSDDRVALFLLDHARRLRLKIFARAEVRDDAAELLERLTQPDQARVAERAYLLRVEAFDWNCPQHITPRFSANELRSLGPGVIGQILAGHPMR